MGRKRIHEDRQTANAERCKKYRTKNQEKYRADDALRKWHRRETLKNTDADKNKLRLQEQAFKKKLYRQRKRNEANTTTTTATAPDLSETLTTATASVPVTPEPSTSAPFKHNSTRARSLKKAEKALPLSPNKRIEVVKSLASNVLRVNFKAKGGRPATNILSEDQREWLVAFLDRIDISRQTPGRKDHVYVGKVDGERKYLQKRYLLWNLRDLLEVANGSDLLHEEGNTFTAKFGKKLKFSQLYQFLKLHKEYKWNRDLPHESCTCEVCENTRLLTTAINRKIRVADNKLPTSAKEIVEQFSCDRQNAECMSGTCPDCPTVHLPDEAFKFNQAENEGDGDGHDSTSDTDADIPDITYYKWMTVNSKIQKVGVEIAIDELQPLLTEKISELKKHIYVKDEQQREYNRSKEELKPGEFIVHVDYAESYSNEQQDSIQSAYFGHDNFSLFTACCYARETEGGELKKHNFVIVSEASDHSRIAAQSCIRHVIDEMLKLYPQPDNRVVIHLWSDGCASQFRSRFVFRITNLFPQSYSVTRNYNERHHGKGPMDGIGGCIKNYVFRAVLSGKVVINNPLQFAEYAQANLKGIACLYMPESAVLVEPDDVEETPYVAAMRTLQVHKVRRQITKDGFWCLEFYKISTDLVPFYTHWYKRDGDAVDPCGHFDLADCYNPSETCALCLLGETGQSWIQCPLCKYWYHEECYHQ